MLLRNVVRRPALVLGILATVAVGCGSSLPQPVTAPHPESAWMEVPYPPPPAHVEEVPPRPRDDAIWTDGSWLWEGNRWAWDPGGWVVLARGERLCPWETRRTPRGKLEFAPSTWRDASGKELEPPRKIAEAAQRASGGSSSSKESP